MREVDHPKFGEVADVAPTLDVAGHGEARSVQLVAVLGVGGTRTGVAANSGEISPHDTAAEYPSAPVATTTTDSDACGESTTGTAAVTMSKSGTPT